MNANETAGRMIAERDARIKELEGEVALLRDELIEARQDHLASLDKEVQTLKRIREAL